VQQWEPVIAALVAGEHIPDERFAEPGVGPVLRRLQAGERGPELLEGLNLVHEVIVNRVLERLGAGS
jgi:hypothetical protein